ncbi:MAG: hypothetical protein AAFV07_12275, partial [Bacteroidota bacterium]
LLGTKLAENTSYSVGDTRVLRTGGVLGAAFGLYTIGMVRPERGDIRGIAALELLTGLGGMVGTHYLIRDVNYTGGEGVLVALGTAAGGALGFGIGLLSANGSDDFDGPSRFTLTSTMAGLAGGFLLTTQAFKKNGESEDEDLVWELGLAPDAMLGMMPGIRGQIDPMGRKGNAILQAGIRF